MGDHVAALRVLALVLGDIRAAEAFCEQHTGQAGYLALLSLLLAPGEGRAPLYTEACHLLAAQGTSHTPQPPWVLSFRQRRVREPSTDRRPLRRASGTRSQRCPALAQLAPFVHMG